MTTWEWTRQRTQSPRSDRRLSHPLVGRFDERFDERGSAMPLVLVAVMIGAVLLIGVTRLGDAAVRRARVDAIADLSALAAVDRGRTAAVQVAEASGGALSEFEQRTALSVEVEVSFQGISARAAAAAGGTAMPAEAMSGTELDSDPDPLTGRR